MYVALYVHLLCLTWWQVCFAFYDTVPSLTARASYISPDRVVMDITFDLQTCPSWPTSPERSSWQHVCINLHACLGSHYPEGERFEVETLSFGGLIDEVAIAAGSVEGMMSLSKKGV